MGGSKLMFCGVNLLVLLTSLWPRAKLCLSSNSMTFKAFSVEAFRALVLFVFLSKVGCVCLLLLCNCVYLFAGLPTVVAIQLSLQLGKIDKHLVEMTKSRCNKQY